jgi:uncharacterized membrane protein
MCKILKFGFFSISLLFISCTNDSSNDLLEQELLTESVNYTKNVKPIIDANCISCHAAVPISGASTSLVTYNQVKNAIEEQGLIQRITLQMGQSGFMPQGNARLPQSKIDIIVKWQVEGFEE